MSKNRYWTFIYWLLIIVMIIFFSYTWSLIWSHVSAAETHSRTPLPRQVKVEKVLLDQRLTFYSTSREEGTTNYTADGTHVAWGVAACPYSLKFGTRFRIPELFGTTVFTCHDLSIYREGLFDIWTSSRTEAFNMGRRLVTVETLK